MVNNPSVTIVIGSVNRIRMGLKTMFKKPRTKATSKAVMKLSTWTPGKRYEAIMTTNALANQLRSIPIPI